ncbi:MAG: VOC family protein [Promethearchaeota archaeon]
MIIGIDVVFLHIRNPKMMVRWYKEKLGLEIGFQTPDLSWQEFDLPPTRPPTRFALDYPASDLSIVEKQPIVISFKVLNIYKVVTELKAKGIKFFGSPVIQDVGPSLYATFQDPEGNWLQISQRKK